MGRDRAASAAEYEPLTDPEEATALEGSAILDGQGDVPFSWTEYNIFVLLGMAMLWAWNMFLAAAPYFASRFAGNDWIQSNFQSAILSISTVTNLGSMLVLTHRQSNASYPYRINLGLGINAVIFALLTASTAVFLDSTSPVEYLIFLLLMVAATAWATGLIQNGTFAFAASFGRAEYMQAIMAGQGVAGVLPSATQVISVLIFPPEQEDKIAAAASDDGADAPSSGKGGESSAFIYFLAAVVVCIVALAAFVPLVRRHNHIVENRMVERMADSMASIEDAERAARKFASPWRLFLKLHWLALAIAISFAETMFFPVFTAKILSVNDTSADTSIFFTPPVFIPVAFFAWNFGDLIGRMATIWEVPRLQRNPRALFILTLLRAGFIPLYLDRKSVV